jgi:hypothetical protein
VCCWGIFGLGGFCVICFKVVDVWLVDGGG